MVSFQTIFVPGGCTVLPAKTTLDLTVDTERLHIMLKRILNRHGIDKDMLEHALTDADYRAAAEKRLRKMNIWIDMIVFELDQR